MLKTPAADKLLDVNLAAAVSAHLVKLRTAIAGQTAAEQAAVRQLRLGSALGTLHRASALRHMTNLEPAVLVDDPASVCQTRQGAGERLSL